VTAFFLDVNVLLALAWPNHQHHQAAHRWFQRHGKHGWATCALTELAFVRLSSNPAYTPDAVLPRDAAGLLSAFTEHAGYRFVEKLPAVSASVFERVIGHQQLTDAYVVHVAETARMFFATFDRRAEAHATNPKTVVAIASS
jgi:uncharacterized protein